MKHIIVSKCEECPYKTSSIQEEVYCSQLVKVKEGNSDYHKVKDSTLIISKESIRDDCPLKDYKLSRLRYGPSLPKPTSEEISARLKEFREEWNRDYVK